jgi:hypothetical protein
MTLLLSLRRKAQRWRRISTVEHHHDRIAMNPT